MNHPIKLLRLPDLRRRGIPWTRQHIHHLVKLKRFPKPVKIGENTNAWVDFEIEEWLATAMANRELCAETTE